ncbi:hypothetical protein K438DRAFT_1981663 [Mycena galopus ATCC 62051]|nr:hypothetical protein K438DRAFT_1981663 [Mycena galopus ATCC 62051]
MGLPSAPYTSALHLEHLPPHFECASVHFKHVGEHPVALQTRPHPLPMRKPHARTPFADAPTPFIYARQSRAAVAHTHANRRRTLTAFTHAWQSHACPPLPVTYALSTSLPHVTDSLPHAPMPVTLLAACKPVAHTCSSHPPAGRTHACARARRALQPITHTCSLRTHAHLLHTRLGAPTHVSTLLRACLLRAHACCAPMLIAQTLIMHAKPPHAHAPAMHPHTSRLHARRACTPSAAMLVSVMVHAHPSCSPTFLLADPFPSHPHPLRTSLSTVLYAHAPCAHACPSHENSSCEPEHPQPSMTSFIIANYKVEK